MTTFILILFCLAALSLIAFIISMITFLITKFKKGKLKISKWIPICTIVAFILFSALDIGIINKVSAGQKESSNTKKKEKNIFGINEEIYSDDSGHFHLKGHYKPNETILFDFTATTKSIEKLKNNTKCDKNGNFDLALDYPKDDIEKYKDAAYIMTTIKNSKNDFQIVTVHPSEAFKNEILNGSDETDKKENDTSKPEDSSDSTAESKKAEEDTKDPASYNTGITYSQLARTPDDYKDKKVKFTGDVAQVIEGDSDETQLRVRVNGKTDDIILVDVEKDVLKGSRVLENDLVEISGISNGLTSYESTIGGKITIPAISCDILNNKGKAPDGYGID